MVKETLAPGQLLESKRLDKIILGLSNLKEVFKHYELNGVYLLEEWNRYNPKLIIAPKKTHMGFPMKYKVVYISPQGIPYLRKLTSTGNPTGDSFLPPEAIELISLRSLARNGGFSTIDEVCQRFIPDPEQLDAILLQEEFDPMAQHRDKSKLYNEINKHNKKAAIRTDSYGFNQIGKFFKSAKPGDMFWTAPEKQYVVQSVIKTGRDGEITATDMNHATVTFNFSYFMYKRLYKEKPRSFSQETKV